MMLKRGDLMARDEDLGVVAGVERSASLRPSRNPSARGRALNDLQCWRRWRDGGGDLPYHPGGAGVKPALRTRRPAAGARFVLGRSW